MALLPSATQVGNPGSREGGAQRRMRGNGTCLTAIPSRVVILARRFSAAERLVKRESMDFEVERHGEAHWIRAFAGMTSSKCHSDEECGRSMELQVLTSEPASAPVGDGKRRPDCDPKGLRSDRSSRVAVHESAPGARHDRVCGNVSAMA